MKIKLSEDIVSIETTDLPIPTRLNGIVNYVAGHQNLPVMNAATLSTQRSSHSSITVEKQVDDQNFLREKLKKTSLATAALFQIVHYILKKVATALVHYILKEVTTEVFQIVHYILKEVKTLDDTLEANFESFNEFNGFWKMVAALRADKLTPELVQLCHAYRVVRENDTQLADNYHMDELSHKLKADFESLHTFWKALWGDKVPTETQLLKLESDFESFHAFWKVTEALRANNIPPEFVRLYHAYWVVRAVTETLQEKRLPWFKLESDFESFHTFRKVTEALQTNNIPPEFVRLYHAYWVVRAATETLQEKRLPWFKLESDFESFHTFRKMTEALRANSIPPEFVRLYHAYWVVRAATETLQEKRLPWFKLESDFESFHTFRKMTEALRANSIPPEFVPLYHAYWVVRAATETLQEKRLPWFKLESDFESFHTFRKVTEALQTNNIPPEFVPLYHAYWVVRAATETLQEKRLPWFKLESDFESFHAFQKVTEALRTNNIQPEFVPLYHAYWVVRAATETLQEKRLPWFKLESDFESFHTFRKMTEALRAYSIPPEFVRLYHPYWAMRETETQWINNQKSLILDFSRFCEWYEYQTQHVVFLHSKERDMLFWLLVHSEASLKAALLAWRTYTFKVLQRKLNHNIQIQEVMNKAKDFKHTNVFKSHYKVSLEDQVI